MSRAAEVFDDRFAELIDLDAVFVQIVTGLRFTEGPVWVPMGDYLLFSDVRADHRYRWDERDGARVVDESAQLGNGMTLDLAGRLVVCETWTRSVTRTDGSGTGAGREVLASHHDGKRLNSPNDVVGHSDGSLWFSDPWTAEQLGLQRERELDVQGVYRIAPDGRLQLVVEDFTRPNGLAFSPDESTLYVDDTILGQIRAFDVLPGGGVANGRLIAEGMLEEGVRGGADGMKVDARGNLWVTGPRGVWVFDPEGVQLARLRTPERVANLAWGGPDLRSLYLTATTSVYRVRTKVAGRREPFMH